MSARGNLWIAAARVPLCLLTEDLADAGEGLALVDLAIAGESSRWSCSC